MPETSAGLLMFRTLKGYPEVFLVHPGGPFFKNKDLGSWTIPKGLQENGENLLATAQREFLEETGILPQEPFLDLGFTKLKSGKTIYAWAFETFSNEIFLKSNTFQLEWPPKSGKLQLFPEVDKADFFTFEEGLLKLNEAQGVFIRRLQEKLS